LAEGFPYLLTLTGEIELIDIARDRATAIAHPETEMPLWQNDPAPAIRGNRSNKPGAIQSFDGGGGSRAA
jgi:hypothetical protein